MARRNKKSAANDSVDLIAMFPWWVGVSLAVVAYIYFHRVASQPAAVLTGTKQLAQFATGTLWRTVAMFAQYAVPFSRL